MVSRRAHPPLADDWRHSPALPRVLPPGPTSSNRPGGTMIAREHAFLSIRTHSPSSHHLRSATVHLVCTPEVHVCTTENTAGANRCHRSSPVQQSPNGRRLTLRSGHDLSDGGAPIGDHSTRPG